MEERNTRGVSGSTLKWIAVIAMFLNHLGNTVLYGVILNAPRGLLDDAQFSLLYGAYSLCHAIGRISLPIFCFLIVEGVFHTRDAKRYWLRLTAFALISEIPFDFAHTGGLWDLQAQNVFWTLSLGLAVLILFRQAGVPVWVKGGAAVLAAVVATLLHFDGSYYGIAMMVIFYLLREHRRAKCLGVGALQLAIPLAFREFWDLHEVFALASLVPIFCYNGERGSQMKYFFYWFYPVHFLLLGLLTYGCVIPLCAG